MRNRSLLSILMAVALVPVAGAACGTAGGGKIMADTPVIPFEPLDADEIAGIDEDDDADEELADDASDDGAEGDAQVPQATPAAAPATPAQPAPAKPPAAKPAQNPQK